MWISSRIIAYLPLLTVLIWGCDSGGIPPSPKKYSQNLIQFANNTDRDIDSLKVEVGSQVDVFHDIPAGSASKLYINNNLTGSFTMTLTVQFSDSSSLSETRDWFRGGDATGLQVALDGNEEFYFR